VNRLNAIQSFATGLIQLGSHFNNAKQIENGHHSTDLREGFDNTVRLFFNTLEKFNIKGT
jgi:molecular chaperone GrpE (heat shock protein)